jgi:glycosyltransferase involved in cell wall biosynthesis
VSASTHARRLRRGLGLAAMAVVPPRRGVYYCHPRIPDLSQRAWGGMVKLQTLAAAFPNTQYGWDILYGGSSTIPSELGRLLEVARIRRAAVVWNQDGVAYPAWHGPGYEGLNSLMSRALAASDHVFFQSEFCRASAERYLGPASGSSEVLHNAVDTERFRPRERERREGLTLLLGGNQYERYRLEAALAALAEVRREDRSARLVVTGRIGWSADTTADRATAFETARRLGVADHVDWTGPYSQLEAPEVLGRADVLLHTKVNDPCPTIILEAMACGLPVVYSATGGTPELVGDDAGVGVPGPLDWEEIHPPDPCRLAEGVLRIAADLERWSAAARSRAVRAFDVGPWLERHRQVFDRLRR